MKYKRRTISSMGTLAPNIERGGSAIPLGNNLYWMKGRQHSAGGIDIGDSLEVENNEVMQMLPNETRVFSSMPMLGGYSPAQLVANGNNPDLVFKAQERWKRENRVKDDGTVYKGGGIHIDPANRGKFTAEAKAHGMGVQTYAKKVLANKENYDSTTIKRANFAKNASKWKRIGGKVKAQYGVDIDPSQITMAGDQLRNFLSWFNDLNIRRNLYYNIDPMFNYQEPFSNLTKGLNNSYDYSDEMNRFGRDENSDFVEAVFAKYLGVDNDSEIAKKYHNYKLKVNSEKPTFATDNDLYYEIPLKRWENDEFWDEIFKGFNYNGFPIGYNSTMVTDFDGDYWNLGDARVGRALDPTNGEYWSIEDVFDINPFDDIKSLGINDLSMGYFNPVNLYARRYVADMLGLKRKDLLPKYGFYGKTLPELIVTEDGAKFDEGRFNFRYPTEYDSENTTKTYIDYANKYYKKAGGRLVSPNVLSKHRLAD